jgi:hypothetical protein
MVWPSASADQPPGDGRAVRVHGLPEGDQPDRGHRQPRHRALRHFIEERHEAGEPLLEARLDAGIIRLCPVLVTVGATVLGLFPLDLKVVKWGAVTPAPAKAPAPALAPPAVVGAH